jgi:hypothetical protein
MTPTSRSASKRCIRLYPVVLSEKDRGIAIPAADVGIGVIYFLANVNRKELIAKFWKIFFKKTGSTIAKKPTTGAGFLISLSILNTRIKAPCI